MKESLCLLRFLYVSLSKNMNFYAVAKGRSPGIYQTWDDCKNQVNKFPGAVYKKFSSQAEAQSFIEERSGPASKSLKRSYSSSSGYSSSSSSGSVSKYFKKDSSTDQNSTGTSTRINFKKSTSGSSSSSSSLTSFFKKTGFVSTTPLTCSSGNSSVIPSRQYSSAEKNFSFNTDTEGRVDIFTDGACSSNGSKNAKAGIGVYFGDHHPANVSKPVEGRITNNSAEIEAVIEAAKVAKENGINKIRINTDSAFLINCQTKWIKKWKARGWTTSSNKPVLNKVELQKMDKVLSELDVEFNHVRGHKGIYGNEMADKLARAGAEQSQ
ncbi:ribonuclease H1 isoform X1 [Microplitis mediator]|uniref:ribonuclease H1 isoform X1 n=1 Tax=Microplitis mediator TaxID=375433 RepID=UPI002555EBC7|nr:ribonuclease H1 isoform X1 [Microplitis mediator]XP_057322249.1 ribonuclease H1 isoform X1 [Microplitis mediator]